MSSSKNKENKPPSSSLRARSSIPSLVKSPQKEELFTNSFLGIDDASQTSLIPTPHKGNASLSKPRRKIYTKRNTYSSHEHPDLHQSSHSNRHSLIPQSSPSHGYSLPRQRSPLRPLRTSTPPLSSDGLSLASPASTFSSPPRALTDTYQRIEQEEDLAATEGQISDPDDLSVNGSDSLAEKQSLNRRLFSDAKHSAQKVSRTSTPTQEQIPARLAGSVSDRVEAMSDPTGMSFFEQMEDRDLAAKLTPMALQAAADRHALRSAWSKQRPVAFGKAMKYRHALAMSAPQSPQLDLGRGLEPVGAVTDSKPLYEPVTNGQHHQRAFSDITNHLERRFTVGTEQPYQNGSERDQRLAPTLPVNSRVQRPHFFAKNHGFPPRNQHSMENDQAVSSRGDNNDRAKSESPGMTRSQLMQTNGMKPAISHSEPAAWSKSWHEMNGDYSRPSPQGAIGLSNTKNANQEPSQIDWLQAGADVPLPSVEENELRRSTSSSFSKLRQVSPEKIRKWDNDFTGLSFQVSESPPVRSKVQTEDYAREREMQGLERAAVTTSRLTQLRERESREQLRSPSKSPAPESLSRVRSETVESNTNDNMIGTDKTRADSSLIPRRANSSPAVEQYVKERNKSHDILQRLARGSSSTPRSSPPPNTISKESITKALGDGFALSKTQPPEPLSDAVEIANDLEIATHEGSNKHFSKVEDTPRVTGAWTDTILPDTIRTVRQPQRPSKYAQTPNISAGGWIDTPFVPAATQSLPALKEDTEEIPAELMQGIVKDDVKQGQTTAQEQHKEETSFKRSSSAPKSIALQLLEEQKEKLNASMTEGKQDNDTLNLGNATIQSLEGLLGMDEAELTTLSRLGDNTLPLDADFNEDEVLERLGIKLDRLRSHIHDARKGIAKLEHQVSAGAQTQAPVTVTEERMVKVEKADKPTSVVLAPKASITLLPATLITICMPIPLMFHPRRPGEQRRLPRPTFLGWITFIFWSWYLIECIMCSLYSHPQYAEFYTWPSEPEPRFPFVLPTMLWRWSQMDFLNPWVVRPLSQIFVAAFRVINMWLGFTDGFTDDSASTLIRGDTLTALGGDGHNLDMMSDEYL